MSRTGTGGRDHRTRQSDPEAQKQNIAEGGMKGMVRRAGAREESKKKEGSSKKASRMLIECLFAATNAQARAVF